MHCLQLVHSLSATVGSKISSPSWWSEAFWGSQNITSLPPLRTKDEIFAFRLAAFAEMDAGADIRAALQVAGRPQAGRVQGLQAQAESTSRRFIPVRQVQEFAGHEHAADGLILQIVEVQRLCGVGFRTPQGPRRFRRFREIGGLFLGDAQRGRVGVALGAQARPGDIQRQGVDAAGGMAIVAGKGFGTEHGLVETEAFGQALVAPGIPVGQRALILKDSIKRLTASSWTTNPIIEKKIKVHR